MHEKRMARIAALMMAAAMTVSLAACGGKEASSGGDDAGSDSKSADGDKVITYWNIGTEGADKEALEYAVNEFNANTKSGYTVETGI